MKKLLVAILAITAAFVLVACAPANYDKGAAKMEKAGYTVLGSSCEETEAGVIGMFNATKIDTKDLRNTQNLTATLYASAKQAKEAYKNTKDEDGKSVCELCGKWVIVGTEQAVKDFK